MENLPKPLKIIIKLIMFVSILGLIGIARIKSIYHKSKKIAPWPITALIIACLVLLSVSLYAATSTKRLVIFTCTKGGKTNFTQKLVTTGQSVTLRVTPTKTTTTTYVITKVTRDDEDITNQVTITASDVGTYTFTPTEVRTRFHATLAPISLYTITVTCDEHGKVSYPTKPIATGKNAVITIMPNKKPRYIIDSVTANGVNVTDDVDISSSGNGTYTFVMGNENVALAIALRKINLLDITATITPGDSGRVFPTRWSIGPDKSRNFTCYPANGYTFEKATLDATTLAATACKRNSAGNTNCKVVNTVNIATDSIFTCYFRTCNPIGGDCTIPECKLRAQACLDLAIQDCNPLVPGSCSQAKCKTLPKCQLRTIYHSYQTWYSNQCTQETYYDQIKVPFYPTTDIRQTCAPVGFWCTVGNNYWRSALQQATTANICTY